MLAVGAASLLGVSGDARRGVTGFHDHHILCGQRPECIARGWTGHSHRWKRGARRRTAQTVAWPLFPDDVGIKGLGVWGVAGRVGALVGYAASRHPFLRATPPPTAFARSQQASVWPRTARSPSKRRSSRVLLLFFLATPRPSAGRSIDGRMDECGWTPRHRHLGGGRAVAGWLAA